MGNPCIGIPCIGIPCIVIPYIGIPYIGDPYIGVPYTGIPYIGFGAPGLPKGTHFAEKVILGGEIAFFAHFSEMHVKIIFRVTWRVPCGPLLKTLVFL